MIQWYYHEEDLCLNSTLRANIVLSLIGRYLIGKTMSVSETLRKDRKGISKPFKDKNLKRNVKITKKCGNFWWSDKRHVNAISNAHTNELKQTLN